MSFASNVLYRDRPAIFKDNKTLNFPLNKSKSEYNYEYKFISANGDCSSDFFDGLTNALFNQINLRTIYLNVFHLYQNELNTLLDYVNSYEDSEEDLINFFESIYFDSSFETFYRWSFNKLNNYQKEIVLSVILSTNLNKFSRWYKESLISSLNSSSKILAKKSSNILALYKDKFDAVKI